MADAPHRIDVHHHFAPPAYCAALEKTRPVFYVMKDWTTERSLDDMDKAGIKTSMLSITTPGTWFGDAAQARQLARIANDYAAGLVRDHPGRFGLFTTLSLPDIEGSLKEIEYGFDTLKADGVGVYTSYDDKHLGDKIFAPVFEELNRRKAVVYCHPVICQCCTALTPEVNEAVIEYGTDTTRTIASLLFSGAASKYPDIKFIWSHGGGTMPFLIERFINLAKLPHVAPKLPKGLMHELKRFYYDTAQASNPSAMGCLRTIVEASQIVFGTDFPYRRGLENVEGLAGCNFTTAERRQIDCDNALGFLSRLKA